MGRIQGKDRMFVGLTAFIPQKVCVAVSGGPDSMFALDFCLKDRRRVVEAIHVNHGTPNSSKYEDFVSSACEKRNIRLDVKKISNSDKPKTLSQEECWSICRRAFFNESRLPVVTGHNLDDAVEWWLMRAFCGQEPTILATTNGNVVRPFLKFSKQQILDELARQDTDYVIDPSNDPDNCVTDNDTSGYTSGKENPNLRSVVRKRFLNQIDDLTRIRAAIKRRYQ